MGRHRLELVARVEEDALRVDVRKLEGVVSECFSNKLGRSNCEEIFFFLLALTSSDGQRTEDTLPDHAVGFAGMFLLYALELAGVAAVVQCIYDQGTCRSRRGFIIRHLPEN